MHDSCPVKVLHCQDELPDVFAGFVLLEPFLLVDLVHQVASRAQLHDQVVAVLSFQYVQQLGNIGVADHLLDLPFPPQVLGDIGVLFGSFLVNYFHCHLRRKQERGLLAVTSMICCSNLVKTTIKKKTGVKRVSLSAGTPWLQAQLHRAESSSNPPDSSILYFLVQ